MPCWAPTRRCRTTAKLVLLDFTKVDYINSSGIALVIQMLIEASNSGAEGLCLRALCPHFTKVFTMVGITKYAGLFPGQAEAHGGARKKARSIRRNSTRRIPFIESRGDSGSVA